MKKPNNLFLDTPLNEYISNANKSILSINGDKEEQRYLIDHYLDDLRIKYNKDPITYNWNAISTWYINIQQACGLTYIDRYAILDPTIINFEDLLIEWKKQNNKK